jgi:hypothetical protein
LGFAKSFNFLFVDFLFENLVHRQPAKACLLQLGEAVI